MVNKTKDPLLAAMKAFEKTTKNPTNYLKEQKEVADANRLLLKSLFDYAKSSEIYLEAKKVPSEIYVDQMDEEQIWQQLEMQNDFFYENCMSKTCRLLSLNENKMMLQVNYIGENGKSVVEDTNNDDFNSDVSQESESLDEEERNHDDNDEDEDEDEDEEDENDSDNGSENTNEVNEEKSSKSVKNETSKVDDKFFKFSEMEAFLDDEDKKELDRLNKKSSRERIGDEIDYFDSLSESENDDEPDNNTSAKRLMFADFFDTNDDIIESVEQIRQRRKAELQAKNLRKSQQMKEDLGIDDSEEENNDGENDVAEKSEYDLRQQRLKIRIEELEEKMLSDKPWQLKGEITSTIRPKNSLLEEVLEFDSVVRPAPLITEETTMCLEDLIKRRIKSKAWDDVERKIKPIDDSHDFRKNLVLQQEKSKESLSQIYEKEYLEKIHKLNNVDDMSKSDEPPKNIEIRRAMKDLFMKLDALSNFHFSSRPVAPEAKIITNIPAIEMEEVAPVSVSDATLLAPEEVRIRHVGDDIGKSERSSTDKKRERRKKKIKQKLIKHQNDKRVEEKEKLGIKVTSKEKQHQLMNQLIKSRNVIKGKNTTEDGNKSLKSSKGFFNQLQDNIAMTKSKSTGRKKSANDFSKEELSAKRIKL